MTMNWDDVHAKMQAEAEARWNAIYAADAAKAMRSFRAAARKVEAMLAELASGCGGDWDALRAMREDARHAVGKLCDRAQKPEIRCWQPAHDEASARCGELRAARVAADEVSGNACYVKAHARYILANGARLEYEAARASRR